jgi:putative NADH-flavin reductase
MRPTWTASPAWCAGPTRWSTRSRAEGGNLDWTYLSPAAEVGPGERTGKYQTGGEQLLVDAKGKSFISFEDYAVAALHELEKPRFVRKRFTVAC